MKLTPEQLREDAAARILIANGESERTQWWMACNEEWVDHGDCCGSAENDAHDSIKNGYLLRRKPEPKTRPWSKPEDVPGPVCWTRCQPISEEYGEAMVVRIAHQGIYSWSRNAGAIALWSWEKIRNNHAEYSTDRKEWKPCEVTE